MVMIIHRTNRDMNRCRRKYGEAWKQYEREVPYIFIPVSVYLISAFWILKLKAFKYII